MIDVPRENNKRETKIDKGGQPTEEEVAAEIAAAFTPELIAALPPEAAALLLPDVVGAAPIGSPPPADSETGDKEAPDATPPDPKSTEPWPKGPQPLAKIKSVEDDNVADDWHDPFSRLTPVQQHVALGLSRGLPKSFLANEFGVSRRTIQRWKNRNELFQRAVAQLQLELRNELVGQIHDAAEIAVRNVAEAVKQGKNARLAFQLIRHLGLVDTWNCPTPSPAEPRRSTNGATPHNRIAGLDAN
jgi:hypothetical protein